MAENQTAPISFGILSLLEGKPHDLVKAIWQDLEERYGLTGMRAFAHPHLSFQAGQSCALDDVSASVRQLLGHIEPFGIEVSGLGHFGQRVIYLKVRPTPGLCQIHRAVNEFLNPRCLSLFAHYRPEDWVPHITLANDDIDDDTFERIWKELSRTHFEFRQTVRNLCLVRRDDEGRYLILNQWNLKRHKPGSRPDWSILQYPAPAAPQSQDERLVRG